MDGLDTDFNVSAKLVISVSLFSGLQNRAIMNSMPIQRLKHKKNIIFSLQQGVWLRLITGETLKSLQSYLHV